MGLQWSLYEAPKLEKYLLECLELNRKVELDRYPRGLRRLVERSVFDPIALRYLRQLLLFSYKAYVEHDNTKISEAIKGFVDTNSAVGEIGSRLSSQSPSLLNEARRHCHSVLFKAHKKEIIPSHGPGAVTTSKETWMNRYSTIETLYPYSDYFSLFYNDDHLEQVYSGSVTEHIEAKLIAVPKDSRGPRLICVHPAEAIWIQQGLRRSLERAISLYRPRRLGKLWPHGHVFFDDQSVNGRIALLSSKSRRYATLDMKEASDRVSEPLVQILFGDHYKWFGCCRAQKCRIPAREKAPEQVVDINCYAPMGNATTFPVQSLVFWAICSASLQRQGFHQPGAVFVFGDDIIVPTECAEVVINDLESFGLLVNRTKSFWRGAFRESCGVDAFNGINVTPIRWKTTLDAEHLTGLQSLSDIAMRLRLAGYDEAANCAYDKLRKRLKSHGLGLFLTNNPEHGGLAEFTKLDSAVWRDAFWHRDTQQFASPVHRLECVEARPRPSGWNHVLESVCSLERTGRSSIPPERFSRGVRLNRGWMPIL